MADFDIDNNDGSIDKKNKLTQLLKDRTFFNYQCFECFEWKRDSYPEIGSSVAVKLNDGTYQIAIVKIKHASCRNTLYFDFGEKYVKEDNVHVLCWAYIPRN